jgi:hypothetical protein
LVGQPLLAVGVCTAYIVGDSQEWLSYKNHDYKQLADGSLRKKPIGGDEWYTSRLLWRS